jgi:FkbM family methyltransferase
MFFLGRIGNYIKSIILFRNSPFVKSLDKIGYELYHGKIDVDILEKYFPDQKKENFNIISILFPKSLISEIGDLFVYEARDLLFPYYLDKPLLYNHSNIGEGTYESELVRIRPGDIVLDVGANIGIFTLFSLTRGAGLVYAFEPVKFIVEHLRENIELNGYCNKVKINELSLINYNGFSQMEIDNENMGAHKISNSGTSKTVKVVANTLDYFVERYSVNKIDFIKVDIEGSEMSFLEGAMKTIRRFKPKIVICTYHKMDDPVNITNKILEIEPSYVINYYSKKLYAHCSSQ